VRGVTGLLALEDLVASGERRFDAVNLGDPDSRNVVFGGQLMAQAVMVADRLHPGRPVRTLFANFARPGAIAQTTTFVADPLVNGRSLASETLTVQQGERLISRIHLLLDSGDEPYLDHGPTAPEVGSPDDAASSKVELAYPGCEVRTVGDVDTWDAQAPTGPATLQVWLRWPHGPLSTALSQAMLVYATDGFLIGTAMRPYEGVGQDMAHGELSTGVISHTMTFHAPFQAGEWLLMDYEAPYAGHGRVYGRGQVFQDGKLVASLVQDSIVRAMPGAGDHRSAM
jgi:acyl-CoA thioesterase-2